MILIVWRVKVANATSYAVILNETGWCLGLDAAADVMQPPVVWWLSSQVDE